MSFGKPWTPKAEKYWRQAKHDLCVEHDDIFFSGAWAIATNNSYLIDAGVSVQMADIEKDFEARYNSLNSVLVKDLISDARHREIAKLLAKAIQEVHKKETMEEAVYTVYDFLRSLNIAERRCYYKRFKNSHIEYNEFLARDTQIALASIKYFAQTYITIYETFYSELFKGD